MTLPEFQATRVWSDNLATDCSDVWCGDSDPAIAGWVYAGHLFIEERGEHWHPATIGEGHWYLILGNEDWITDDLESLEMRLFEYAQSEGIA